MKRLILIITFWLTFFTIAKAECDLQANFKFKTKGLQVSMHNLSEGTYSDIEWLFSDGTSYNVDNPVHTFKKSGTHSFTLMLTTKEGCATTVESKVHVFDYQQISLVDAEQTNDEVQNNFKADNIELINTESTINNITNYPNPFTTNTTLSIEMNEQAKVNIQLMDMSGRLIHNIFEGIFR